MSINIIKKVDFAVNVKLKARTQGEINDKREYVKDALKDTIKILEEKGVIEEEVKDE